VILATEYVEETEQWFRDQPEESFQFKYRNELITVGKKVSKNGEVELEFDTQYIDGVEK
jgi:hypothetical protein